MAILIQFYNQLNSQNPISYNVGYWNNLVDEINPLIIIIWIIGMVCQMSKVITQILILRLSTFIGAGKM